MSVFTQTAIGVVALTTAGTFAVKLALMPFAPMPLTVHSLTYADGMVVQDRTIATDQSRFYASWVATVIDEATGAPVKFCTGQGAFPYAPGRREVAFTLQDWTGRPDCELPPGKYRLSAVWSWGDEQTAQESVMFEVPE